ncbi:MAG: FapA family protein [Clostridiales bacterium]|nr:FapA family protein [Clostridiales bacterium]
MNGYFRLVMEKGKTGIKLIPPTEGGSAIRLNDVIEYLTMKDYACDLPTLKNAVAAAEKEETVLVLEYDTRLEERECYKLTVTPDKMKAYAKFYAASSGGANMTPEEMIRDLEARGIRCGVKRDAVERFFQHREYCEDILIAEGVLPLQGRDAYIEYKFNTDKKAKPTLKEDGSVDFFSLNILNHCAKGDVLAVLHPEEPGTPGETLYGERLRPADVKKTVLKYGNNIELSEDGTTLTSQVDGHVELVEGTVFVSDVLVVENVDNSTGNIDYEGNVQINGNVGTNFVVRAQGDILVKGVVEGASLWAGGNIVIVRGMNGMGKGSLQAEGNIIAKFLENVTAQAKGYVSSESILHSQVTAGEEVNVDGRRGFITGGRVCATGSINVKTLGSAMGADTVVEVGADPGIKDRIAQIQNQIEEDRKTLQSVQPILLSTKQKLAQGVKLTPEQLKYIQSLVLANKQKTEAIETATAELEALQKNVNGTADTAVRVKGMVYAGTKICIGDVSMVVQKDAHYCRFVRERGDVKMAPL